MSDPIDTSEHVMRPPYQGEAWISVTSHRDGVRWKWLLRFYDCDCSASGVRRLRWSACRAARQELRRHNRETADR